MAKNQPASSDESSTFKLAFTRSKIKELFKSPMVKAVLFTEIRELGPDAELIVRLMDKIQPVTPVKLPRQQQPNNNAVQAIPPRLQDGRSEEKTLEVVDSEDELVNELILTQRQEQRLRRQLQIWKDRTSSSSSHQ